MGGLDEWRTGQSPARWPAGDVGESRGRLGIAAVMVESSLSAPAFPSGWSKKDAFRRCMTADGHQHVRAASRPGNYGNPGAAQAENHATAT
jgi:hypothetical protein